MEECNERSGTLILMGQFVVCECICICLCNFAQTGSEQACQDDPKYRTQVSSLSYKTINAACFQKENRHLKQFNGLFVCHSEL